MTVYTVSIVEIDGQDCWQNDDPTVEWIMIYSTLDQEVWNLIETPGNTQTLAQDKGMFCAPTWQDCITEAQNLELAYDLCALFPGSEFCPQE